VRGSYRDAIAAIFQRVQQTVLKLPCDQFPCGDVLMVRRSEMLNFAHHLAEARARRENGDTLMDIARTFNVSHTTVGR
jgi:hypothetical protein